MTFFGKKKYTHGENLTLAEARVAALKLGTGTIIVAEDGRYMARVASREVHTKRDGLIRAYLIRASVEASKEERKELDRIAWGE